MQRFIARENIRRYKQMLAETSDESRQAVLRQLLTDEEAKLAGLDAEHGMPPPKPITRRFGNADERRGLQHETIGPAVSRCSKWRPSRSTLFPREADVADRPSRGGCSAVNLFANDQANAAATEALSAIGLKMIALRAAGFDNVDLNAASEHGISVTRVPAYSPSRKRVATGIPFQHQLFGRLRSHREATRSPSARNLNVVHQQTEGEPLCISTKSIPSIDCPSM